MRNANEWREREGCDGEVGRDSQVGNAFDRASLKGDYALQARERDCRRAQKQEQEGWESLGTECHEP